MLHRPLRRLAGSTVLIVGALTAVRCSDQFAPKSPPPNAALAEVQAPIIFVGAGDIASCTKDGDTKTALLVESILNANPTAWAFTAGDNAYDAASTVEYRDCYNPTWGRFKTRTRPSLGNQEYDGIEGPTPSFNYFGDPLWENSRPHGYYSFNLGNSWHIVVLNSNTDSVPSAVGSPQDNWLKADLAANHRPCLAAIWHHPRFFSSSDAASSLTRGAVKQFWTRLYAAKADLVLNGHLHNYERFAPQNPDGTLDRENGIREFIVGTGGKSTAALLKIHRNSEVRHNGTLGVMQLTLNASSYSWRFVPEAGKTFTDVGTNDCHSAPASPPPNVPPTADFSPPSCIVGVACTFTAGGGDPDGTIQTREWDFGDPPGTPITTAAATAQHTYAAAGVHSVTLKVTDNGGVSSAPVANDVAVAANRPPVAAFTPPACTTGVACSFLDQSTDDGDIVTRNWDFGDPPGTVVSTPGGTLAHTYTTPGDYSVTLIVVDNGGATSEPSAQHLVTVSNTPLTAAFRPACDRLACTFTDQSSDPGGSVTSWSWDFGDGSPISAAQNPQHTYAAGGSKTVTLTVTDNGDEPSVASAFQTFTVAANVAPTAAFTSSCSGLTCTFTNLSTDSDGTFTSRWNYGDGSPASATPSRTYAAAGTYIVTLTVTDNDLAPGSTTRSVNVTAPPPPPPISLSVTGRVDDKKYMTLIWTGARTATVDVYRDGNFQKNEVNDGRYVNSLALPGKSQYTYKVCEVGTTICSNEATVVF